MTATPIDLETEYHRLAQERLDAQSAPLMRAAARALDGLGEISGYRDCWRYTKFSEQKRMHGLDDGRWVHKTCCAGSCCDNN